MHPRDRLARAARKGQDDNDFDDNDVEFIKQVPVHPRDKLKNRTKNLRHPKDGMKEKELPIARDNVSALCF